MHEGFPNICIGWNTSCFNWLNPTVDTTGLSLQRRKQIFKNLEKLAQLRFKANATGHLALACAASQFATLSKGSWSILINGPVWHRLLHPLCGGHCLSFGAQEALHQTEAPSPGWKFRFEWSESSLGFLPFQEEKETTCPVIKSVPFGTKWIQVCILASTFSNSNESRSASEPQFSHLWIGAHLQITKSVVQHSAGHVVEGFSPWFIICPLMILEELWMSPSSVKLLWKNWSVPSMTRHQWPAVPLGCYLWPLCFPLYWCYRALSYWPTDGISLSLIGVLSFPTLHSLISKTLIFVVPSCWCPCFAFLSKFTRCYMSFLSTLCLAHPIVCTLCKGSLALLSPGVQALYLAYSWCSMIVW